MRSLYSKESLHAKKGGLGSTLVFSVVGLIVGVIVAFIIVQVLVGANLLTVNSVEANATTNLRNNLTAGVDQISAKIPTIFSVAVIVIILAVLLILVGIYKKMNAGGGIGGSSGGVL